MENLKTYFKPHQPSVGSFYMDKVCYKEIEPKASISDYIYCFWELKSAKTLNTSFVYRVVSDGCIDILIDLEQYEIFITGFSKKYIEFNLGTSFHYVGVRFYPFMFPLLFNIPATTLVDQFFELEKILPELYKTIKSCFSSNLSLKDTKHLFDTIFTEHIISKDTKPVLDLRLIHAIEQILQSGGNINLKNLDISLSQRQLRRLFEHYFGESPKVFAKVFRFQNILNAKPSIESLKTNKIFYDKGYYDQAHFIRDFKRFYGVTPSQAFGRD